MGYLHTHQQLQAFALPVALSLDGEALAAGSNPGSLFTWRVLGSGDTLHPSSEHDMRQRTDMSFFSKLMPELAVLATVALQLFAPEHGYWFNPEGLMFAAMADGATLMLSATLIDVASRLRRAPPRWLGVMVALGILAMYPDTIVILKMAWTMGLWVFLPFAWSIIERLRELWTLPSASALEKIRRRTLTFDRLYTALIAGGACVAGGVINAMQNGGSMNVGVAERALPWLMLAFYGVAAINVWRVHRLAFAKRPRSLWPWIDQGQATYLDPL